MGMNKAAFEPGARVVRTGPDLPHLGVHAGRVYEVETCDGDSDDGLFVKGVLAGLDQAAFSPVRDDAPLASRRDVETVERAGWPDDLPGSTYDLIRQAAERFGQAKALSFFLDAQRHEAVRSWTFEDYAKAVTQAANLFGQLVARREEVVALFLPNLPEMMFCLWGAEAVGVALPINPLLEPAGLADLLRASGAKILVTLAPFPGVDLYEKAVAALAAAPSVHELVLIDLAHHAIGERPPPPTPGIGKSVRVTHFHSACASQPDDRLHGGQAPQGRDIASLFGTGGSTGAPKLARRTHANEVANAFMGARALGRALTPGDVVFAGLPLFHVNGAMVTGLASLFVGSHVLLASPQGFRGPGVVAKFWEIVEHHRVVMFSAVPTLLSALLATSPDGRDLSALRFVICGAAPLSPELIGQFEAATGVTIVEGYGLTEATCTVALNPITGERRAGSVGLPLPFQKVRIARLSPQGEWLADAAPGETGQVMLAGPNIFQGYGQEHQNAGVFVLDEAGARWLNTGDLGALDTEGRLWLRGRSKDVIIRSGHNIDPALIEDAFYAHPAVALAAAIGRPDPHAGEVPVAYVQLKPGETVLADELARFAESRIAERAARPKAVRIIETMPLTAIGKVFKPALREREAAEP
jgi:fatty-acyl-CoA synthase